MMNGAIPFIKFSYPNFMVLIKEVFLETQMTTLLELGDHLNFPTFHVLILGMLNGTEIQKLPLDQLRI